MLTFPSRVVFAIVGCCVQRTAQQSVQQPYNSSVAVLQALFCELPFFVDPCDRNELAGSPLPGVIAHRVSRCILCNLFRGLRWSFFFHRTCRFRFVLRLDLGAVLCLPVFRANEQNV